MRAERWGGQVRHRPMRDAGSAGLRGFKVITPKIYFYTLYFTTGTRCELPAGVTKGLVHLYNTTQNEVFTLP